MIFKEKRIILKNGKECTIKTPDVSDAENLIEYLKKASSETGFMLRYPEEVTITVENEMKYIESLRENTNSVMISAYIDDKLVANVGVNCVGNWNKTKHRASLGIAVIEEAWGLGIGKALMNEALEAAKEAGYEQVELEVASNNFKAIKLYEQFGFVKYGTRSNAFKFKDGTYSAEHLMLKELKEFR